MYKPFHSQPYIIHALQSYLGRTEGEDLTNRNNMQQTIPYIFIANHIEIENCITQLNQGLTNIVLKENLSSLNHKVEKNLKESYVFNNNVVVKQSTDKNSCEIKSSKNEATLQAIFDNSMEAILLANKEGFVISANPAASNMLQMTLLELCKKHWSDLIDLTDPKLKGFIKEQQEKGRCKEELRLVQKDGTKLPAIVSSVNYTDVYEQQRILVTINDLSTCKEGKKKLPKTTIKPQEALDELKKLMDSSLDILCTIDEESRFVQVSASCKSTWGYSPHELIGKNYLSLIASENQDATINIDNEIKKSQPERTFEKRMTHKNGTTVYVVWTTKWDKDEKLFYCTAKDITGEKKLEKAYEIGRQRFLDFYNHSPSCMGILKGPTHIYEMANPLCLKLIGKTNIIGKTVMEVLPELKDQGIIELLDGVYNTGVPFIANERRFNFDLQGNGNLEDKYLNILYQAHRNLDGIIDGILFFAIDATEQVKSRIKIEESEKMYRQLIRELPVAAYSCDAAGKIKIFNKAAATLWGVKPKIGKDLFCGFSKLIDNAGHLIPAHLSPMAVALKEGRTVSGWEGTVERPNGERRNVIPHVVPYIDSSGKVTGAVNVLTDITESKAAQKVLELRNKELADYKYALDESNIVGITDANGIIIYANTNFCKISKYSFEELIGQDFKIINSGYHSKEYISNLWQTITQGKIWKGELRNKAKDGSYYWVDTTIISFLNEQGNPYQFVTTKFDITERKNAELNLEIQNIKLLKTNKELDRFVYSVSHDLRSPLTSVQGLASIIEDETKEPETMEHVQMIKYNINRLDDFIRNILSYSQNNRTGLEVETIPVKETITDITLALKNITNAQGIHFDIDVEEHSTFYSDRLRFKTIIENLISNAIKYHKSSSTERFIKVKAIANDKMLQLKVSDNGIGIPLEYQEKIFDMFFRISSKSQGSGIGLYIVKDTIEKLEGSINVSSQIKSGTTFEIKLKNFKIC
ncbi:PAS domain S-box protein [Bizionia gelidisalsuginis]|uniref:histidine kinase n=2 Tax=Bizionia gelidisalsuginis TaxID=291188 RepID=A0ABY3MD44_9FLAO|nr:PAS domain S-box protein [Bizionia gelidisalsuginis]